MAISRERVEELKKQYPKDKRLFLQHMNGEPNMPEGLRGTVDHVDGIGQIHVH